MSDDDCNDEDEGQTKDETGCDEERLAGDETGSDVEERLTENDKFVEKEEAGREEGQLFDKDCKAQVATEHEETVEETGGSTEQETFSRVEVVQQKDEGSEQQDARPMLLLVSILEAPSVSTPVARLGQNQHPF